MFKSGSLIIRRHSPWMGRFAQIGLLILAVSAGTGLYYLGQFRAGYNHLEAREAQSQLEDEVSELRADKAALRDKIALIEQSMQVDQQAYLQVNESLKALQKENLELREEVSFYRGIVAPGDSSAGIRLDSFKIEKANENNLFHYKFVLTQVLKTERAIRGTVKINLEGNVNGMPKILELEEVTLDKRKLLDFNFTYFQRFEGDFKLPKDYVPRQLLIEISPFKGDELKLNIAWPDDAAK